MCDGCTLIDPSCNDLFWVVVKKSELANSIFTDSSRKVLARRLLNYGRSGFAVSPSFTTSSSVDSTCHRISSMSGRLYFPVPFASDDVLIHTRSDTLRSSFEFGRATLVLRRVSSCFQKLLSIRWFGNRNRGTQLLPFIAQVFRVIARGLPDGLPIHLCMRMSRRQFRVLCSLPLINN